MNIEGAIRAWLAADPIADNLRYLRSNACRLSEDECRLLEIIERRGKAGHSLETYRKRLDEVAGRVQSALAW